MIFGFFAFFMFNFLRKILGAAKLWGTFDFLDKLGFVFVSAYLMVLLVGGVLAIFVNPRAWCQFCPNGDHAKSNSQIRQVSRCNL